MSPTKKNWHWNYLTVLCGGMFSLIDVNMPMPVLAQVVPDRSLGTVVTRSGNTFRIQGGRTVGGRNLFHSFNRFDVPNGGVADFLNDLAIDNIFGRVTGGNASTIQGVIRARGGANLFLLNPQGILFGPNARLSIGGSFVGTTANAIQFSGGGVFSQTSTVDAQSSLLSIEPSALFFNRVNPGRIENRSTAALSTPNQSLLLVGGDVRVNGGRLIAAGGRVELGGLAEPGVVGLTTTPDNLLGLTFPEDMVRSNVLLSNRARISVLSSDGGSVTITARNLDILEGSRIFAGIASGQGTASSQAGDITLNATEQIRVIGVLSSDQLSGVDNTVSSNAVGNSGNINIITKSLEVANRAQLNTSILGRGNAGSILINARDKVVFNERGVAGSAVFPGATGDGGDVRIATNSLEVSNGSILSVTTLGQGNAGNIFIDARNQVVFNGLSIDRQRTSSVISTVSRGAKGNGGNLLISTGSLEVDNGATLSASTLGQGNAGSILIDARDQAMFTSNSNVLSQVDSGAIGNAGDIRISTGSLEVSDGAQLSASTRGQGNAGSILIDARNRVLFTGTSINGRRSSSADTQVVQGATGNAGNVRISTGSLEVLNGARLAASTSGQGNAGSILIDARDHVLFDGTSRDGQRFSSINSHVVQGATGNAGNIQISAESLKVSNGAQLSVSTFGQGNAGSILVDARDRIVFAGTGRDGHIQSIAASNVNRGGIGNGGDVRISTSLLEVSAGAALSASTFGQGSAGNLIINARDRIVFAGTSGNGHFFSTAASEVNRGAIGNGGDVRIDTGSLEVIDGAELTTSTSGQGNAGNVIINARDRVVFTGTSSDSRLRSAAASSVQPGAIGNAGDVHISSGSLEVSKGAKLLTSTFSQGNAGNVVINIRDRLLLIGTNSEEGFASAIFSTVQPDAIGNGGSVRISAGSLEIFDGARILTSTSGRGNAGNVVVDARDRVNVVGASAKGKFFSGIIGSSESVGRSGDIIITTPKIRLDRQGRLIAESNTVDGGNIILNLRDWLVLRRGSTISATAGLAQKSGNGGNIILNAPKAYLIAVPKENSDIIANAFAGSGGRIKITAQGIYGLQAQPRLTPFSDITASSELGVQGSVTIDTPDIDPNRGLQALPTGLVDPSSQIRQRCPARTNPQATSSFVITGRGGLPQHPGELPAAQFDTSQIRPTNGTNPSSTSTPITIQNAPTPIVEATQWQRDATGKIRLIAAVPRSATPQPPECPPES